jgi:hypothetical protein
MRRTWLLMIEITIWTVGAYLILCNLANPPRKNFIQVLDISIRPPVLYTEDLAPVTDPQYVRWQLSLPHWREQSNGGIVMLNNLSRHVTRVDIPRTILWLTSILITTTFLALIPRLLRRRLPPRPAFPVETAPTPITPAP